LGLGEQRWNYWWQVSWDQGHLDLLSYENSLLAPSAMLKEIAWRIAAIAFWTGTGLDLLWDPRCCAGDFLAGAASGRRGRPELNPL
jgi:hypothetical protein